MSEQIIFTSNAANKVFELIQEEEKKSDLCLRVTISGGGCSGFQYGFMFDENITADDYVVSQSVDDSAAVVKLVVDPISMQYLSGSEVDYQTDLQGEQFIVRNPNANTTCGCGSSFSI